jgi:regulator of nucleoside diphosphate kinase
MQKTKEQLILAKNDYEVIMTNLKTHKGKATFNRQDAEELEAELKKARLVNKEELPCDVVRLNSRVTIKDEMENSILELTVVTPEKADIKEHKISIMSPMGTALIGYRKGNTISWRVPAGKKTFTILEVVYPLP